jgi:hypothetical protein
MPKPRLRAERECGHQQADYEGVRPKATREQGFQWVPAAAFLMMSRSGI